MHLLHDPTFREDAKVRIRALRADAERLWGKMTVGQMLWHLNRALENSLGRFPIASRKIPLPGSMAKFLVINIPWFRGKTPTAPELVAKGTYDVEKERARLLDLIDEFAARPLDGSWSDSAFAGPMNGQDWTRLQGKHVDYHLQQFGA